MSASLLVIIPSYNEQPAVLRSVVEDWRGPDRDVCVIDDGSNPPLLANDWNIHLLRHERNRGQGAALRTGLRYGLTQPYQYFISVDADGQHPVENLEAMLHPLRREEADVVFGSRFKRPQDARAVPGLRRWVLRAAVRYNNFITGLRMTDAHNGLRALNRRAAEVLQPTEDRMAHASELPLRTRRAGLRWREVSVHIRYTSYAAAKGQTLWRAFPLAWELLRLKWRYR